MLVTQSWRAGVGTVDQRDNTEIHVFFHDDSGVAWQTGLVDSLTVCVCVTARARERERERPTFM